MAESKLKIDIRRKAILEQLRRDGKVYVTELSKAHGVTPVTIRNDLDVMEKEGELIRMNGGAVFPGRSLKKPESRSDTEIPCLAEKETIAKTVASMIRSGDTVFINSGTTTDAIAAELCGHESLNVVTNSLSAAMTLGNAPSFRVILLGGEINSKFGFTYGADAQEKLSLYHADWAILSVDGIDAENGITTYHAEEAILDRMMIRTATHTVIAADRTKIGRTGFLRVCACEEGLTLVTNDGGNGGELAALAEQGVTVLKV